MKKGRRKRKKEKEKEKGKWEKGNGKKGKREKEKWKMERGSKAGPKAVSSRGIESVSAMIVLSFPLSFFFLSFFFLFSFLLLVTREKIGKEREECVRIHKQKIRRKQLYYNFQLTCTVWGSQLSEKGIKLRLPGVDRLALSLILPFDFNFNSISFSPLIISSFFSPFIFFIILFYFYFGLPGDLPKSLNFLQHLFSSFHKRLILLWVLTFLVLIHWFYLSFFPYSFLDFGWKVIFPCTFQFPFINLAWLGFDASGLILGFPFLPSMIEVLMDFFTPQTPRSSLRSFDSQRFWIVLTVGFLFPLLLSSFAF